MYGLIINRQLSVAVHANIAVYSVYRFGAE